MSEINYIVKFTHEFNGWFYSLPATLRTRIDARLEHIKIGHFGDSRSLGDGLFELKWKNGMRVYYSRKRIQNIDVIVVWGGFKDFQQADIAKARKLKVRYENELTI